MVAQALCSRTPGSDHADVAARVPGKGKLKAIEDAPGSYVMVRSQDS